MCLGYIFLMFSSIHLSGEKKIVSISNVFSKKKCRVRFISENDKIYSTSTYFKKYSQSIDSIQLLAKSNSYLDINILVDFWKKYILSQNILTFLSLCMQMFSSMYKISLLRLANLSVFDNPVVNNVGLDGFIEIEWSLLILEQTIEWIGLQLHFHLADWTDLLLPTTKLKWIFTFYNEKKNVINVFFKSNNFLHLPSSTLPTDK